MNETRTTAPKAFCFVLMPFDKAFADVYQIAIKEACSTAGAYCERVDEQIFHERILDRIYNQIAKADLVIADMTGRNPNVFYEVGYAHALGKATILITRDAEDIPFDLKHFPHVVYEKGIAALRDELARRVHWHVANPTGQNRDGRIDLEVFLGDKNLSSGRVVHKYPYDTYPNADLTVHNASAKTFDPGEFTIGLATSHRFYTCQDKDVVSTRIPGGGYLHRLPPFPRMFPEGYSSYHFSLVYGSDDKIMPGGEDEITVRVYTQMGTRDFPLVLKRGPNTGKNRTPRSDIYVG